MKTCLSAPERRSSLLLLTIVGFVLLGTPAHSQDKTAAIDTIFSKITPATPGCVCAVSQNGKVIVNRAYGSADLERHVPLSPGSIFDIGSAQKQFTAAAVLLLVEDGRIALSDDIRKYLPELPDYGHAITVDHLLTHTSGIRDWPGLLPMAEEGVDVLKLILRQRGLNFVPGEEWSYSSSGYVLAKEIVSRVSGMTFAEFARKRLFEPLGMKSSAYVEDILKGTGERALGYLGQGASWKQHIRLGNERGGGAVISTAGDMLIWNDALTTGRLGKFVTAKLEEPATLKNGRKLSYARGLNVTTSAAGDRLVSHSGDAYGYSAWAGRFTNHGLSVAVLCNFNPVSATALARQAADVFLPPVDPQKRPPGPVAAEGVDVTGRAGLYLDERTGEPMRLVLNDGKLNIAGGPPLVAVSADRFLPPRATLFYRSEDAFELTFRSNDAFELKSMEGQATMYRRAQPWSPTAAELQATDGRYSNEDLGTVFEIVPGTKGLVLRFERTPERALDYEPVARDAYMRNTGMVRFNRDAGGRVVSLDYYSPMLRNVRFTRLGDRKESSAAVPATKDSPPTSPAAAAPKLEALAGEYELAPGRNLAILLEAGQLYGQPSGGGPKLPLTHVSGTTFSAAGGRTLIFTLGSEGRATALVMQQNGNERSLPRVR